MRQSWVWIGLVAGGLLAWSALGAWTSADEGASAKAQHGEAEHGDDAHGPKFQKYKYQRGHDKIEIDLRKPEHREVVVNDLLSGRIESLEGVGEAVNPMEWATDLGVWTVVIFVLLLFVLRKLAWNPMLEGLQKREETIKNSVEEAKKARAETERITMEFKVKMDQAYAEIPKIMEQARRDAEAFKEEVRNQTTKEIQNERQRLRREIDTARDQALQELWNQAAQLATLISAKAIGRSLTEDDHRRLLDEAIVEVGQAARR